METDKINTDKNAKSDLDTVKGSSFKPWHVSLRGCNGQFDVEVVHAEAHLQRMAS